LEILLTILEFSKKHSQPIIIVLLGLLATGSIAGGMWIHDLRDTIAARESELEEARKLGEQRQDVEKQRLATATAAADLELRKLRADLNEVSRTTIRVKTYVDRIEFVVKKHLNNDRMVVARLTPPGMRHVKRATTEASAAATTDTAAGAVAVMSNVEIASALMEDIDHTSSDIAVAKDWVDWMSSRNAEAEIRSHSEGMERMEVIRPRSRQLKPRRTSAVVLFVWILMAGMIVVIYLVWRRRRHRQSSVSA